MPAKAGISSAPHCEHFPTNNLFIVFPSTPQPFLGFGWLHAVTRVTPKYLESIAKMKLQQAAAKLLSEDEARRIAVNIAKLPELLCNLFCSIVAKANLSSSIRN